ncbi:MAG: hypothetical protein GF416_07310 [Candidatus Altiarchaeales archaeon]|nr:hypothetical protein [Candidatus Altiarchaeales archaeon]MBD3416920.1 hypothetical protein [Candidatus Altiarchaeales archaeon]
MNSVNKKCIILCLAVLAVVLLALWQLGLFNRGCMTCTFGDELFGPRVLYESCRCRTAYYDTWTDEDGVFQSVFYSRHMHGRVTISAEDAKVSTTDNRIPYDNRTMCKTVTFNKTVLEGGEAVLVRAEGCGKGIPTEHVNVYWRVPVVADYSYVNGKSNLSRQEWRTEPHDSIPGKLMVK